MPVAIPRTDKPCTVRWFQRMGIAGSRYARLFSTEPPPLPSRGGKPVWPRGVYLMEADGTHRLGCQALSQRQVIQLILNPPLWLPVIKQP